MIDGMMILGQWSSMDGTAIILLMLGLIGFIIGIVITASLWSDLEEKGKWIGVVSTAVCAFLIMIAALVPIRNGLRVTLTDPTKMPELVEKYEIVKTNGLILDIEERKEK